jgi:hypothetical protein
MLRARLTAVVKVMLNLMIISQSDSDEEHDDDPGIMTSDAAWTMHFQIIMKERPTKCIYKVNHIFRISILLLRVSALQERHL